MRVVTTCHKKGLDAYGHRWLDSRDNWPEGTEFIFYTEGFEVDCPSKDLSELKAFSDWKGGHKYYVPPRWEWDVVRYANKVFAAADALYDYDGLGVWLDADCVTYQPIPPGLIGSLVKDHYLGCYQRGPIHTETGLWIMDCGYPGHKEFLDAWRHWYLSGEFRKLPAFTDCHTLDATIAQLKPPIVNLSGDSRSKHPQAESVLGQYIDHCKGKRKREGLSPENQHRQQYGLINIVTSEVV